MSLYKQRYFYLTYELFSDNSLFSYEYWGVFCTMTKGRKGLGNCYNVGNPENCANTVPLVLNAGDKVNIRTNEANFLFEKWSRFKERKI